MPSTTTIAPTYQSVNDTRTLGRQLMVHALALFPQVSQREGPHGADVQQLLIGWIAHTVPTKVTPASDAPPPPSLSSVAQIVQTVENALPELPAHKGGEDPLARMGADE